MITHFRHIVLGCLFLFLVGAASSSASPENHEVEKQFEECLLLKGSGDYNSAIQIAKQIIESHPDFQKIYRHLAELYILSDGIENGKRYFSSLSDSDSSRAGALYGLAYLEAERKNFREALRLLKKAVNVNPYFEDCYGPNSGIVNIFQELGDLDGAVSFLTELMQKHPENPCVLFGLARAYQRKYQWEDALKYLNRAVELDSTFPLIYHAFLGIYESTGKYMLALSMGEKLFNKAMARRDPDLASYALAKIGGIYYFLGDYQRALNFFARSLELSRKIGARRREGMALNNIAIIYAMLGIRDKALEYFYASLDLARKSGSRLMEVRSLSNIGNVYKDNQEYAIADSFYSVAFRLADSLSFLFDKSLILSNRGEAYQKQKQFEKARKDFKQALQLAKKVNDKAQEGYVLRTLGGLHKELNELQKALYYYKQALQIGYETEDLQVIWESEAGMGACFEQMGNAEPAIKHYGNAIALYDSIRNNLDIESLTTYFLEDKYEAFPSIIRLLAENGRTEEAFRYAEKYKAKVLLDVLADAQYYIKGLLPDSLHARLNDMQEELTDLHRQALNVVSAQDHEKQIALDQRIRTLELERAALLQRIRSEFGDFYQLTAAELRPLEKVQAFLRHEQAAIVEFIVGPQKIASFVIRADSLLFTELPLSRSDLESLFHEISPLFVKGNGTKQIDQKMVTAQLADFKVAALARLYQKLMRPLIPLLESTQKLVIIPDDILNYLPFEMLITDTSACETPYDFSRARFMLHDWCISYAPSVNILMFQSEHTIAASPRGLFAIGNPNFDRSSRINREESVVNFVPLPYSEKELRSVADALKGRDVQLYTGNEATEKRFRENAAEFRALHLATHFEVNDRQPLYSRLVLAQNNSGSSYDGFLYGYEIFGYRLNAQLVVLSACNTALGRLSKGEGLLGISRAFFFAGVPSLVLSLWNVDDAATSDLMESFYRFLSAGVPKNEALQHAKLEFLANHSDNHSDPFYWAPFILTGSWTPIEFVPAQRSLFKNPFVWIAVFLFLFASFLVIRKFIIRSSGSRE